MNKLIICSVLASVLLSCGSKDSKKKDVSVTHNKDSALVLAETPPMGWNSFDSYGVYLYEEAALKNVDAFAEKLKPHGYEYFVIDAGWFGEFELKENTIYPKEKHAKKLNFNEHGLLQPSKTYFPNGLKPIIERCHKLGIKFGIHLMRGIPRDVVYQDLPIKGTEIKASAIADTTSICVWNNQNYGVDMSKPGAQEFYNSLLNQLADWGVDFVKYDDIVPFPKEVEAVVKAIAQTGRPMVLSLSPGGKVDENAIDTFEKANMLRVTHDIWDEQASIDICFDAWRKWQGKEAPGFWIDMDMIPFGQLQLMSPKPDELTGKESKEELEALKKAGKLSNVELLAGKGWKRESELSKDQKHTFITIRALSASPLMMGGDLPTLDDFSLELITHPEVIACNQNGVMGRLIYEKGGIEIWKTRLKKDAEKGWIGVFNRNDSPNQISLTSEMLELAKNQTVSDIWNQKKLDLKENHTIAPNGVLFLKIDH